MRGEKHLCSHADRPDWPLTHWASVSPRFPCWGIPIRDHKHSCATGLVGPKHSSRQNGAVAAASFSCSILVAEKKFSPHRLPLTPPHPLIHCTLLRKACCVSGTEVSIRNSRAWRDSRSPHEDLVNQATERMETCEDKDLESSSLLPLWFSCVAPCM